MELKLENKAYEYAKKCIRKNNKNVPKYIKKQAKSFVDICENKEKKYIFDINEAHQIENILKLLIMPNGLKAGQTMYQALTSYQWLVIEASLCVVYRDNPKKRRYEKVILEICRKNFKTSTVGIIFIILLILEPKFSQFYSVAPDGTLSREIKEFIERTLHSSPVVYLFNNKPRFKILRDYIFFNLTSSKYVPLNYSSSRLDGRFPNVFLADEVGALPNNYAIEAMSSGQINILNKLGFIISTKYPTIHNPFEDEVEYAKRVLDGIVKDDTLFALLYEPDDKENWMSNDYVIKHSNPVALEIPEIWDDLIKKRTRAIAMPSARENFVTKHCNIIYQGAGTENYVDVNDLMKCRVPKIEWSGRTVYIGVDLAMSNDNASAVMVALDDDDNILIEPMAFIPEARVEEKTKYEKIDYQKFINELKCIACGYKTIDYTVIEEYVMSIEDKFDVTVAAIGYDRWNALSSAQKWSEQYKTIEVRQHSDTLHPVTKYLSEKIANNEIRYVENTLYEINFENAKCTYDTNMNRYVSKKRSNGKVDMVFATLDALYCLYQEELLHRGEFVVQVI